MALVATLVEFKAWLRYGSGTSDDLKLTDVLTSASEWVEWRGNTLLAVTSVTESLRTRGWSMQPSKMPLVTVTSITPEESSTPMAATAYKVDTTNHLIRFYRGVAPGWYTVVYTAGHATIPYRLKNAGLELARHLWLTQNGSTGRGRTDDDIPTPMGFAVPRRVDELMGSIPTAVLGFA